MGEAAVKVDTVNERVEVLADVKTKLELKNSISKMKKMILKGRGAGAPEGVEIPSLAPEGGLKPSSEKERNTMGGEKRRPLPTSWKKSKLGKWDRPPDGSGIQESEPVSNKKVPNKTFSPKSEDIYSQYCFRF